MPLTRSAASGKKTTDDVNGKAVKPETKKATKTKASTKETEAPPKKAAKKAAEPAKAAKSKKTNKKESAQDEDKDAEPEVNESEDVPESDDAWQQAETIYEFTAKDIKGNDVSLEKYKGHVCIITNVASKCGHTKSNYEQFVDIFNKYSDTQGLRILAFPCNEFGKQEPGDNAKICEFAEKKNVKFDMFEKIEVNGENAHPLWKFLTSKSAGPKGNKIPWNFTKFIIDKEGKVVERYEAAKKPSTLVENLEKYW